MEELSDNLIVSAFNAPTYNVYSILVSMSDNIRQPFKLLHYFEKEQDEYKFALFYARLDYFNTDVFLLKNFYLKEIQEPNLFHNQNFEMEYLIKLKSPKMYILLTYSKEIKNIKDVEKFIGAEKLNIQITPITSKKLISALHQSVQSYYPCKEY